MARSSSPASLNYFEAARSWDDDVRVRTRRSAKIAWCVAGGASVLALAAMGTLAAIAPLKTVEPYVIRVSEATGAVDIVRALDRDQMKYDEAVARYFVWQYMLAREDWLPATADINYRRVVLMSVPDLQRQWSAFMSPGSSEGPQKALGEKATAKISLKTISFLQPNIASVRFSKTVHHLTGEAEEMTSWIATVTFAFHPDAAMSDDDRMVNPFGFIVEDVRTDREPVGAS